MATADNSAEATFSPQLTNFKASEFSFKEDSKVQFESDGGQEENSSTIETSVSKLPLS